MKQLLFEDYLKIIRIETINNLDLMNEFQYFYPLWNFSIIRDQLKALKINCKSTL
jgi:hypothetical protein